MPQNFCRRLPAGFSLAMVAALAACTTINTRTESMVQSITPYTIDIVQGNFISREQVQALRPGMSRLQVQEVLGTPLVASIFHADRWDYVFTFRRRGAPEQSRRLSVFFRDDVLERFEGDEMPGEIEFANMLNPPDPKRKVPVLEAPESDLARHAGKQDRKDGGTDASAAQAGLPPSPDYYPPLE